MKKLTRTEMKNVLGGDGGGSKGCLALGAACGDCTDPESNNNPCCPGLVCSGGGIIAGQCIVINKS